MSHAAKFARFTLAVAAFTPALALAHPGHGADGSFATGALHPLSGVDHIVALLVAGLLAARLGGRFLWPMASALLGLLVAAWTADSDGWRFAAGFMLSGMGLIATGVAASRIIGALAAPARRSPA